MEVKDIMTPNPITSSEDASIEELAEIMIDNGIHRIIILKDEIIVGIVSPLNLLYHVAGRKKDSQHGRHRPWHKFRIQQGIYPLHQRGTGGEVRK